MSSPKELARSKISFLLKINLDGISVHSGAKKLVWANSLVHNVIIYISLRLLLGRCFAQPERGFSIDLSSSCSLQNSDIKGLIEKC